jgi:hypothetical protein
MGLFDRFRKQKVEPAAASSSGYSLPSISYGIAYFILPHYAFKDCEKIIGMFTDTRASVGPFFYLMGCQVQKTEPVHEDALRFRSHQGKLDDERDYFVLEYPTPPPIELSGIDPVQLTQGRAPVLAPHFSALVRDRQTKAVRYYTLGQAPIGGGTTLRSVTPDGTNCNLGPGPEPRIESFLTRLRSIGKT